MSFIAPEVQQSLAHQADWGTATEGMVLPVHSEAH